MSSEDNDIGFKLSRMKTGNTQEDEIKEMHAAMMQMSDTLRSNNFATMNSGMNNINVISSPITPNNGYPTQFFVNNGINAALSPHNNNSFNNNNNNSNSFNYNDNNTGYYGKNRHDSNGTTKVNDINSDDSGSIKTDTDWNENETNNDNSNSRILTNKYKSSSHDASNIYNNNNNNNSNNISDDDDVEIIERDLIYCLKELEENEINQTQSKVWGLMRELFVEDDDSKRNTAMGKFVTQLKIHANNLKHKNNQPNIIPFNQPNPINVNIPPPINIPPTPLNIPSNQNQQMLQVCLSLSIFKSIQSQIILMYHDISRKFIQYQLKLKKKFQN